MRLELPRHYPRIRIIIDGEEVEMDPHWSPRIVQDYEKDEVIISVRTPNAAYRRLEAAWHGR